MEISTFFLRISARCNLDCDYCYVFKHRDSAWKNYPSVMTDDTITKFCSRLKEYLTNHKSIEDINIVFHGGEPLVFGTNHLLKTIDTIDSGIGDQACMHYSLQTNGTLLTEEFVSECSKRDIGISISIDGMKSVHDKHRKYKNGTESYDDVLRGMKFLKKYPNIFEGVIGVIDPAFDPDDILSFFESYSIENVDLLLPDSTYLDLPIGREQNPNLYRDWLISAFDSWFFRHQSLNFRTFEFLLRGLFGDNAELDAFGLGSLDYLTIETDGTYHTSDILKVAYENASYLGMNLTNNTIDEALASEKVKEYNRLLSYGSLPEKCKVCKYSDLCGGGSLPHRYSPENLFDNPTIYCNEMYALIEHASNVLEKAINDETN